MSWKKALGIEGPHWIGIGKHLGEIAKKALNRQSKTACDLTNHLREVGNKYIEPAYVDEYLAGNASFGCFFPQFRKFLGIAASDVFRKATSEEEQKHLKSLDEYLTDSCNEESFVIFLKHRPGRELREYVADFLRKKREEALNRPYHSIDVGLDPEQDKNPYMAAWRELLELLRKCNLNLGEKALLLTPPAESLQSETSTALAKPSEPNEEIYKTLVKKVTATKEDPNPRFCTTVGKGTRIMIYEAFMRGRRGYTIDFISPEEGWDGGFCDFCGISLEAWKELYTRGVVKDTESISGVCLTLGLGIDELIPTREPTPAERYELHQRWAWRGGWGIPGASCDQNMIRRKMENRPDPVGRSEMESDAYQINSNLTTISNLVHRLPELIKDAPLLEYKGSGD